MSPTHGDEEMAQSEIAQRVVNNTLLTAINRVGLPIFAGLMVIVVIPLVAWYFNGQATLISNTQASVGALSTRVTMVEDNQRNGADRAAQAQLDIKTSISDLKDSQTKLSDQNTIILEDLAGINALLKRTNP